ncbi:MAG TPA: HlyD family secretion protein [Polyangiaceae bacterium]|jgi:membrane fusion protein (multidrug efflux system)
MTTAAEVSPTPANPVPIPQAETTSAARPKRGTIIAAVVGVAALIAGAIYVSRLGIESTDNAQVDAEVVSVPARVGGVVEKVLFVENQHVKAGDELAELDDAPAKAKLAEAEAQLLAAEASAEAADATTQVTQTSASGEKSAADASLVSAAVGALSTSDQINQGAAELASSQQTLAQAQIDRDRAQKLLDSGAISKAEFDRADTQLKVATANSDALKARLTSLKSAAAQAQSRVVEAKARAKVSSDVDTQIKLAAARAKSAHAQVDTARAARDLAALDLSYTKILAPSDGVVSKKSIVVGQMLGLGQGIAQLVTDKLWVVGNFKETQLAKMRVGQPAHFEVDAFPGTTIQGDVESLSGATGSRFTLLPPDNATGNFTKVVQRVPVRIHVRDLPAGIALRPGMSVELSVDTRK